jgi:hypothetical protein
MKSGHGHALDYPRYAYVEPGTRNPEPGTRNPEPGTRDLKPET